MEPKWTVGEDGIRRLADGTPIPTPHPDGGFIVPPEFADCGFVDPPPPLGVQPLWLWREHNPAPTALELRARRNCVWLAVSRYEAAGLSVPREWPEELAGDADVPHVVEG